MNWNDFEAKQRKRDMWDMVKMSNIHRRVVLKENRENGTKAILNVLLIYIYIKELPEEQP